jgi:hypothetical protein
MINRKNLSRLSVGCLIIGLATFGAIFVFGSRSPREQSCWDKTVEALKRQQSILAEMQASVEHQLRDPSYLPPPGERHLRQERLDDLHLEQLDANIEALKLEDVRYSRNEKLLVIAIAFAVAASLGAILLFITRPQAPKQNP